MSEQAASKHLYGIIYHRPAGQGREEEWVSCVTLAESHFDAERFAEAHRSRHWSSHRLHSVTHLSPVTINDGEVFMVSAT